MTRYGSFFIIFLASLTGGRALTLGRDDDDGEWESTCSDACSGDSCETPPTVQHALFAKENSALFQDLKKGDLETKKETVLLIADKNLDAMKAALSAQKPQYLYKALKVDDLLDKNAPQTIAKEMLYAPKNKSPSPFSGIVVMQGHGCGINCVFELLRSSATTTQFGNKLAALITNLGYTGHVSFAALQCWAGEPSPTESSSVAHMAQPIANSLGKPVQTVGAVGISNHRDWTHWKAGVLPKRDRRVREKQAGVHKTIAFLDHSRWKTEFPTPNPLHRPGHPHDDLAPHFRYEVIHPTRE